jgi:hypothetical protein
MINVVKIWVEINFSFNTKFHFSCFCYIKSNIWKRREKKKRTKAMKEKMCHLIIIWVTFDNILSCSTIIHFDSSLFFFSLYSLSAACVMIEKKATNARNTSTRFFSIKQQPATFWSLVEFLDVDWLSHKLSYVCTSNNHKSN